MAIKTLEQWQAHLSTHYEALVQQVAELALPDETHRLLAVVLLPILPTTAKEMQSVIRLLEKNNLCPPLVRRWQEGEKQTPFVKPSLVGLVEALLTATTPDARSSMESLFTVTGVRELSERNKRKTMESAAVLSVDAGSISANGHVGIAGRDVTIITSEDTAKAALRSYLRKVRAAWNSLDLSSIISDPAQHVYKRLHHLYTPLDVWDPKLPAGQLNHIRHRETEYDVLRYRLSMIRAVADESCLVITGGPGTGKSTFSAFLAICLAYACDPGAEKLDALKGIERLGTDWVHGALVPVYVNLRSYSADKVNFPSSKNKANANSLLAHISGRMPEFQPDIVRYLDEGDEEIRGAVLILDGLDEIYDEKARHFARIVIEDFAAHYPRCRVLVTCRTAAYREGAAWRLSARFKVVELAPYTWGQIQQYINNWYAVAAINRPGSMGHRDDAEANARKYATSLSNTLREQHGLWSLARQPLLLTLIALIHEENRRLPHNRGDLYEKTVDLLHKWNPPNEDDPLASKLVTLNYQRVRQALQLTAFSLQRDQPVEDACIKRTALLDQLLSEQKTAGGLGANIEDVLEYLATRNGILVSDQADSYRFLHLSIQEYLAACALIEQYDEITMPRSPKPQMQEWNFPDNLCALLNDDPFRWREVALFCGAILGSDRGQDRLWGYVETLLPQAMDHLEEGDLYRIYIAAEVWAGNQMKARRPSHLLILDHLTRAVKTIRDDARLDAPEQAQITAIFRQLSERPAQS